MLTSINHEGEIEMIILHLGILLHDPQSAIQSAPRSEHEHRIPRITIAAIVVVVVEPVMDIPHQIHQQSVQKNRLIPPEIPLQLLHPNHHLLIDRNGEHRVVVLCSLAAALAAAADRDVVRAAGVAEPRLGRVLVAAGEVPLLPRD